MKNTSRRSHHAWVDHYKPQVNSINYTAASNNIFINNNDNDNARNNPGVTNYRTFTLCTECKTNYHIRVYTGTKSLNLHISTGCDVYHGVRSLAYNFIVYLHHQHKTDTNVSHWKSSVQEQVQICVCADAHGHGAKKTPGIF